MVLDKSAVSPTSEGHQHSTTVIKIRGCVGEYKVIDAVKVEKGVLHTLDRALEGYIELFKGKKVHFTIETNQPETYTNDLSQKDTP